MESAFAPSQSVSATRADQQRFRIDRPNSKPRAAVLIGLDRASRDLVEALVAERPDRRTSVDLSHEGFDGATAVSSWLSALTEKTAALTETLAAANLVVVIASAGADAQAAATVGDVCRARGIRMTALVINAGSHSDSEVAATLSQLRPSAAMVVVADNDIYVADMLQALQA